VTVTSTAAASTVSNVRFEVIGYTSLVIDVPDLTMTGIPIGERIPLASVFCTVSYFVCAYSHCLVNYRMVEVFSFFCGSSFSSSFAWPRGENTSYLPADDILSKKFVGLESRASRQLGCLGFQLIPKWSSVEEESGRARVVFAGRCCTSENYYRVCFCPRRLLHFSEINVALADSRYPSHLPPSLLHARSKLVEPCSWTSAAAWT